MIYLKFKKNMAQWKLVLRILLSMFQTLFCLKLETNIFIALRIELRITNISFVTMITMVKVKTFEFET